MSQEKKDLDRSHCSNMAIKFFVGNVSQDWNDPRNWIDRTIPKAGENVIIEADVRIPRNIPPIGDLQGNAIVSFEGDVGIGSSSSQIEMDEFHIRPNVQINLSDH